MAYSLLTHTAKEGSSASVTTTAIDTTGANIIILAYASGILGAGGNAPAITDTGNNKWWYTGQFAQGSQFIALIFCVNPVTNASHTFSASLSSGFPSLAVQAWAADAAGSEIVTANGANGTTVAPGSATPSKDNALIVTGFCGGAVTTQSIGGGFTISDQIGGNTGQRVAMAYLVQTSAAAANPTWTSSASGNIAAMLTSFPLQAAGGGGGGGAWAFA